LKREKHLKLKRNLPMVQFVDLVAFLGLISSRPGKTDPRPETRTEQPESIPEPTSEMKTTDFDPNI